MLNSWETDARLPSDVIPLHYDISLYPDLNNGVFSGCVTITLTVKSEKKFIILHSVGLIIESPKLKCIQSNKEIKIERGFLYEKNEFYVICLENLIKPGSYDLSLTFNGSLLNKIIGFYRSSYKDVATGKTRQIATSKFEPTYARQAYPCFDEPNFKAEFTVQLVKPTGNNYIALSNMNQVSETEGVPEAGLTTVKFARSVPMSTYLTCFIVCDFGKLESVNSEQGFPVTVYARPELVKNMQYALKLAVETINYYIKYFDINYPLPKLDLIAIPDFVSGAMEHWGLVTFRESSVLFDEAVTSFIIKMYVAFTVTHELAHMWFGNLVTMNWWNDLWLNEGFATFMEYKGVGKAHCDWDVSTQVLTEEVHGVLNLDSVLSSHPIVQTVSHPDQITEIFDSISYSKGSTVIRMLENMVGSETFRVGVSSYLKEFSYKNAETKDLWNHLEHVADGIKISQVMNTWTNQMGYPLVNVKRSGDTLSITQQRFLADSKTTFNKDDSPYQYKWDIQVTYATSVNSMQFESVWLYHDQPSVEVNLPTGTTWFKMNIGQFGYYRVRYSSEEWQKLMEMLCSNHNSVAAADRANLLDDGFSLARAGYIPYKMAFDVIKYLPNEEHFVPWIVALNKLKFLDIILSNTYVYPKFRKFVHTILEPVIKDSLWNITGVDSYTDRRRKLAILNLCCTLQLPTCVNKAKQEFHNWLFKKGSQPVAEFRSIIYAIGIKFGGEEEWEKLWCIYLSEEQPQEKDRLINALAATREPWLLNRFIELAKDENNVRSQDFIFLLVSISNNPAGNPIIWDFIRSNWSYLVQRFTLNDRKLGILIPCVTANFSSKTKLKELETFLAENPDGGAGDAGRKLALEKIQNNISWLEDHVSEIADAL